MTPYHSLYWSLLLTLRGTPGTLDSLSRSIASARVDLNPHQVDAALFALRSPLSKGVLLADEVGLGKTIEAGLVLAQRWAERKRRILVILPATLRSQWQRELDEKFFLPTSILDSRSFQAAKTTGRSNPFDDTHSILLCSYQFASSKAAEIARVPWDLVVIDEAHRLRNVYKAGNKMARAIQLATQSAPKLLLTATPLQNSLMELYGLISVIDDQVFGGEAVFRDRFVRATNERLRNESLRDRLRPICTRTLRKQVTEYVRFTRRIPITQDFFPSDAEQELYDAVSEYLQRETLQALPKNQRVLITLVLRKLLASSTFAIGPTLRRLAERLESAANAIDVLDDCDLEGLDELAEELTEFAIDSDQENSSETPDPRVVRAEIVELRQFADMADAMSVNAKGQALVPALRSAFERAEAMGVPQKAVIFTESRRTQAYLFDLLEQNGFGGRIAMLNGTNTDPHSLAIHHRWTSSRDPSVRSESRAVEVKTALVDHFRDEASILIATEAAAEGVNLQFCALVVNYDLPWNPQRIEQRIGRCHRYGQKHDVVVVNFLNRRNAADQRVFQLLSEKFQLFDGVFGASDEVLGAIESGMDIERRIAAVYQTCRTSQEIEAAFDSIQAELDVEIQARMTETRSALLDNFDEDVNQRLRVHKDRTIETLSSRERWLLDLTRNELGHDALFEPDAPRFEYVGSVLEGVARGHYHLDWREAERLGDVFYRQEHPLAGMIISRSLARTPAPAALELDYTAHGAVISTLKPLVGRSGWLAVGTLTIEAFDRSEFVLVAGCVQDSQGTLELDEDTCAKFFSLRARMTQENIEATDMSSNLARVAGARLREVEERNARVFDEEVTKLDLWSSDLKDGLERQIKDTDRSIQEARHLTALAQTLAAKLEAQRSIRALEGSRNRMRRELFEAQDEIDRQREILIQKMEKQLLCKQTQRTRLVVRWSLV